MKKTRNSAISVRSEHGPCVDSAGIPQEIRLRSFMTNVRQLRFTLRIGNFSPLQPPPTTPGESPTTTSDENSVLNRGFATTSPLVRKRFRHGPSSEHCWRPVAITPQP